MSPKVSHCGLMETFGCSNLNAATPLLTHPRKERGAGLFSRPCACISTHKALENFTERLCRVNPREVITHILCRVNPREVNIRG